MTAPSPDVVGIVLAGGASTRFGSDKLAASLDGRPLLHHALVAIAEVADRIVVVIAPDASVPSVPEALASRIVFVRDGAAFAGPLAGLAAGLAAIDTAATETAPIDTLVREEAPHIALLVGGDTSRLDPDTLVREEAPHIALLVGGDMPTLVPAVLRLLVGTLAGNPSFAAMTLAASEPRPLPMAVRPDAARVAVSTILASGGRRSLLALLEAVPSAAVSGDEWRDLDPNGVTLRDIDAPADLGLSCHNSDTTIMVP